MSKFDMWLREQDEKFQKEILTDKFHTRFANSEHKLEKFMDYGNSLVSLEELEQLDNKHIFGDINDP